MSVSSYSLMEVCLLAFHQTQVLTVDWMTQETASDSQDHSLSIED